MYNPLRHMIRLYRNIPHIRLTLLGVVTGVLSGLAASAFYWLLETSRHWVQAEWAGLSLPGLAGTSGSQRLWIIPLCLMLLGLVTGWLVQRFIPGTIDGLTDGTDSFIKTFHKNQGLMPARMPLIKGVTAALTIGAGGSAGSKGPVSQIGAGVGSWFAQIIRLNPRERRILLIAGAAGGLGAIFRAPLGGALMAIEVLYREDFESEAIVPSVLSSVVSYSIFAWIFGNAPFMELPAFAFHGLRELPFYAALACICGLVGWLYVRFYRVVKYSVFSRLRRRMGIMWTAGLGGLLMGVFGVLYQPALADGYGWIEQAVLGQLTITAMLGMLCAKAVATGLTLGSGMSGGMIAPSLFMGAMTGGCVGLAAQHLFPAVVTQPGAFALVGMSALYAGIAHAPIGPMVLICEFTKGYELLAPLMLCSVITLLLSRRVSLYENQEQNKFTSPAHRDDATINVLAEMPVADYYTPSETESIPENATLRDIVAILTSTLAQTFVVSAAGEAGAPENSPAGVENTPQPPVLKGILAVEDIRPMIYKEEMFDRLSAGQLARPLLTVPENGDLYAALMAFMESGLSELPVVARDDPNRVLGLLKRPDVFRAYHSACQIREE